MLRPVPCLLFSLLLPLPASCGDPAAPPAPDRITLKPMTEQEGSVAMTCRARVPHLEKQFFGLGIPEIIACREKQLMSHVDVREKAASLKWTGPDAEGVVTGVGEKPGVIGYTVRLIPFEDYIDIEMTIENRDEAAWQDVLAFDCLNPVKAPPFIDRAMERTYISIGGRPCSLDRIRRTTPPPGQSQTLQFFLHEKMPGENISRWISAFEATSPDRTDGTWIVTLSDPPGSYMAAFAADAGCLFNNTRFSCIHALPGFGDIGPGESSTAVVRFYFARGSLDEFLARCQVDGEGLASRQRRAGPVPQK